MIFFSRLAHFWVKLMKILVSVTSRIFGPDFSCILMRSAKEDMGGEMDTKIISAHPMAHKSQPKEDEETKSYQDLIAQVDRQMRQAAAGLEGLVQQQSEWTCESFKLS